jgi:hypothetical protein
MLDEGSGTVPPLAETFSARAGSPTARHLEWIFQ